MDDFDGTQNGGSRTPRCRTPSRSQLDVSLAISSLRVVLSMWFLIPDFKCDNVEGKCDPLSLNNRAKTPPPLPPLPPPPPPAQSPSIPNPSPVNGFGNTSQQTMPPFAQSFPFMAPFGQNRGAPPFNPFGKFLSSQYLFIY
ncbi:unnamed protein product [Cylicostephanus goldi]|uniref:Uncharacterized protein n=1 Tax=Cylicostephanus goldi TaxID=71465 RepID=A0A3P7NJK2_CYLGO|nr:unnamed protein product [Cylicostephanus goldi]